MRHSSSCLPKFTVKPYQKIDWFKLTDLPTWKRNKTVPGKFYLITPFIGYVPAVRPSSMY